MFSKIGFFLLFSFSLIASEHVYLKTPNLSRENIIGTNVGIRPYRKSGVRLELEPFHDKQIVHNYGYGGSGLTLCFGGAKEVLDILNTTNISSKKVAVLGAGVVAMATAYDLLQEGYQVHIYADDWSPNLTSNVAAGIWSPLVLSEDAPIEKKQWHQRLLETAKTRFLTSLNDHPEFAGIRLVPSYSFQSGLEQGAIKTRNKGEDVIVHFDNGVTKHGKRIYELGIDGKLFVEDLYSKVKSLGAIFHQRHFESRDELLSLEESIIVNCTSLGSRKLFDDQEFMPVRGQVVYFKPQEGFDFLIYQNVPNQTTTWVSIYPWNDRIVLGGVYEKGEEERVIDPKTIDMIIENSAKCLSGEFDKS